MGLSKFNIFTEHLVKSKYTLDAKDFSDAETQFTIMTLSQKKALNPEELELGKTIITIEKVNKNVNKT